MKLLCWPKLFDPEVDAGAPPITWRDGVLLAGLILVSTALVHLTAVSTELSTLRGAGYYNAQHQPMGPSLFRFDAVYYRDIALTGYRFDGNLFGSPNIVFFPAYPLLIRLVMMLTPLEALAAGFAVSWLCMALGTWVTWLFVRRLFGATAAWFVAVGLHLSPASFALHAYYTESTMLLCLALASYCLHRRLYLLQALTTLALGATRPTALPFCGLFALGFAWLAWQGWRRGEGWRWTTWRHLLYGPLCVAGVGGYLLFIWLRWGNPFVLLPAIQEASWGRFHAPISPLSALVPWHLLRYLPDLFERELFFVFDVRTTHWLCLALGLVAGWYGLLRWRPLLFATGFLGYVLWVYYHSAGTPYLSSVHRYMLLMLPIYLLLHDGYRWLRQPPRRWLAPGFIAVLLLIGLVYRTTYTVAFVAGYWHYF